MKIEATINIDDLTSEQKAWLHARLSEELTKPEPPKQWPAAGDQYYFGYPTNVDRWQPLLVTWKDDFDDHRRFTDGSVFPDTPEGKEQAKQWAKRDYARIKAEYTIARWIADNGAKMATAEDVADTLITTYCVWYDHSRQQVRTFWADATYPIGIKHYFLNKGEAEACIEACRNAWLVLAGALTNL